MSSRYFDSQSTLKIACLGPCKSGKTLMANLLASRPHFDRSPDSPLYDPTVGVRILPFPEQINARSPDGQKSALLAVSVELWDCSGDQKFEGLWPAILDKLDGAIVIFDPTSKDQANEVRLWCEYFSRGANLLTGQLAIFAHGELTQAHKPLAIKGNSEKALVVPILNVSTRDNSAAPESSLRQEFQNFLGGVFGIVNSVDSFM